MFPGTGSRHGWIPRHWVPALLFFVGVVAFLPTISSETSVTEKDEYYLSFRTPMEMRERGEWLTPWLDNQPRLRKPPLLYWAILSTYNVFGIHLWSARIWGVLAGAGLAVSACLIARELSRSDGLLAGLITLGSLGVAVEARQAMLDLPLSMFSAFAVFFWIRWLRHGGWQDMTLSGAALGFSCMVKGPVGGFFFLAGAVPALWLLRWQVVRKRRLWHLAAWLGVLAAVCLPWPLSMSHLWNDHFVQIIGEELAARRIGKLQGMAPLSALAGALGLIFPWTPLVLGGLIWHWRQPSQARQRDISWLSAWIFLSVLPFFFMKSSERYMLAILPAQAVLAAMTFETVTDWQKKVMLQISAWLLALLTGGLCLFVIWFNLGLVAPVLCMAAAGWTLRESYKNTRLAGVVGGGIATFAICLGFVYPALGIHEIPDDVAVKIRGLTARHFMSEQPAMLSMRLGYSVQMFNAARMAAPQFTPPAEEAVFFQEMQKSDFTAMVAAHNFQVEELGRFRTLTSHKVLIPLAGWPWKRPDWLPAIRARSLDSFKQEIYYYRVKPSPVP